MKDKVLRPNRDPDYYSKRNVPYWFAPEFIRGTSADVVININNIDDVPIYWSKDLIDSFYKNDQGQYVQPCESYGRIYAVKSGDDVCLHIKAKNGNLTFIKGSIQKEFKKWHTDRCIDYILLGLDEDEIIQASH